MKKLVRVFLLFGFALVVLPASGLTWTCDLLFQSTQNAAGDKAVLQASYDRLLVEQKEVRDRIWLPRQIDEISKKGRLEFEDREKAVKYYRGLIVWKLRVLQDEIAKISENQRLAEYKAKWPANIRVEDREISLFSIPRDFFRTIEISESVLKVAAPTAEQTATLLSVINRIRVLNRTSWADREAGEAAMVSLLRTVYPGFEIAQLGEITKAMEAPRPERIICCGRGNCEGCTHPNVVFRNKAEWPGPTFTGPSPQSTLPLFNIMDHLKSRFPNRDWGSNFWDRSIR